MGNTTKNKNHKQAAKANPLETLKDIATSAASQMRQEASKMPQDFMGHLFGVKTQVESFSGEIVPGEAIEISQVTEKKELVDLRKKTALERRLLEEERVRVEKKTDELRIQLRVVQQEIIQLAEKTEGLAQETEIASMQAPVEPGIYHLVFFEKLLEFIKSFKKKIEEARVWLQSLNKRAAKKNAWGANYAKHGAKYLLSSEHYIARSAG